MNDKAIGPNWKQTRSGLAFDFDNIRPEMIDFGDIAESLAKMCRFGGHCRGFYSVADHSRFVADLMPEGDAQLRLYALLHDAAEAYTGDIVKPLKSVLKPLLKPIEERIDAAICEALEIPPPKGTDRLIIKEKDMIALKTEQRDLMEVNPEAPDWDFPEGLEPSRKKVRVMSSWVVSKWWWARDFEEALRDFKNPEFNRLRRAVA